MSVKHAMLALLASQPSSTYQLRKRFDASTWQSWPLNIGQVSTTLQRLERDGLVAREDGESQSGQPWRLTTSGREELAHWWSRPVIDEHRGRDELVVKLALATTVPGVDVAELVQTQRASSQRRMHDLTRLRREVEPEGLTPRLIVEHHLFAVEAELRWLDVVEESLIREQRRPRLRQDAREAGMADERDPADSDRARRP